MTLHTSQIDQTTNVVIDVQEEAEELNFAPNPNMVKQSWEAQYPPLEGSTGWLVNKYTGEVVPSTPTLEDRSDILEDYYGEFPISGYVDYIEYKENRRLELKRAKRARLIKSAEPAEPAEPVPELLDWADEMPPTPKKTSKPKAKQAKPVVEVVAEVPAQSDDLDELAKQSTSTQVEQNTPAISEL